ncbi:MAG: glycosyltransferase family 9 protein, partial [Rhodocyclaceae bacterium]|nr:glycosyltransferase family 9 protein [Rhodocyclaceae bacterium]
AVVILSPNLANMLAPLWCGIPRRVAVLADRRRGVARLAWPLLSHGEAHRTGQLFRSTALRALAGLGLDVDDACLALNNEAPRSPAADARAAELLGAVRGPLVGLGLGAGNRMKALGPQQLSELAGFILSATPATLVLVGTGADRDAATLLMQNLPPGRALDTTGRLELDQLPALLAALDCYVGVDSGATYLADAAGVPVVDFMGPADADDQRPLGARAIVVRSAEPCAPCSHSFDAPYHCRLGTLACMKHAPLRVLADQVAAILAAGAR